MESTEPITTCRLLFFCHSQQTLSIRKQHQNKSPTMCLGPGRSSSQTAKLLCVWVTVWMCVCMQVCVYTSLLSHCIHRPTKLTYLNVLVSSSGQTDLKAVTRLCFFLLHFHISIYHFTTITTVPPSSTLSLPNEQQSNVVLSAHQHHTTLQSSSKSSIIKICLCNSVHRYVPVHAVCEYKCVLVCLKRNKKADFNSLCAEQ